MALTPSAQPQRIHLPPGSLYTGTRAYACDGAVIEALVEGSPDAPRLTQCTILELHDLNPERRRTRHDVGAFLRRCLRRIIAEGLIIILDDHVLWVPADRIAYTGVRFQQYCTPDRRHGPFYSPA